MSSTHVKKDGFEFAAITYPYNVDDAIIIVQQGRPRSEFPVCENYDRIEEEYVAYINKHGIEKAVICLDSIEILDRCKGLKYLRIVVPFEVKDQFDFSPVYRMDNIRHFTCLNRNGIDGEYTNVIDFSKVKGLEVLGVCVNKGTLNYNRIPGLKSLLVSSFKGGSNRDLADLFCSTKLDTLSLITCGMHSLNGIEKTPKMQCVYLDYNRSLRDISALKHCKETLKMLRIENCPQIEDFSVLGELENLELLELTGKNTLPNLKFLRSMRSLNTFVFNMNVLDGDLSNCTRLSYVYSETDRKHYNVKDKDLPKGVYIRGNESIEEWRRLE